MKDKTCKFAVLIIFWLSLSILAVNPPSPLAGDQIKIDGSGADWSGITPFMEEFGADKRDNGEIDVKQFHMGFTSDAFYYKAVLSPNPSGESPKEDLSIFQLMFDADKNEVTGNVSSQVYKVKPKGFETRFELVLKKNRELVGRLYSKDDDFNKLITEWKSGSENFAANGNTVEIKIPYSLIKYTNNTGVSSIRILFAEYANMTSSDGYSKQSIKLDFGVLKNIQKEDPIEAASGGSGGFSIWHLMILTMWVVSILCGFAIAPKAGLSSGLAAVNLVPFLGQLIFLFILAFGAWPLHKDYHKLEDRLREFDEEV